MAQFTRISGKVKEKRKEFDIVQLLNLSNRSNVEMLDKEIVLSKKLYELMIMEESFYRQKSRVQWPNEGDLNTIFFHSMAVARQKT